jgi:hypothetical protein
MKRVAAKAGSGAWLPARQVSRGSFFVSVESERPGFRRGQAIATAWGERTHSAAFRYCLEHSSTQSAEVLVTENGYEPRQ